MVNLELDDLKSHLREYVETVTTASGKEKPNGKTMYDCPLPGCESGTGKHKTGAFRVYDDSQRWYCFSCNKGGDIYDLCAAVENLDKSEATKRIIELYSRKAGEQQHDHKKPAPRTPEVQPAADYSADIERFAAALPGSEGERYLTGRGFNPETMQRFHLGYDAGRRCVTIPYNRRGSYYGRRSVDPAAALKHNNLSGVQMPLFNGDALKTSGAVFVVESPLCAISIAQEGGTAIALSGTKRERLLKALDDLDTKPTLLLCLDADDPGRKASDELAAALEAKGFEPMDVAPVVMGGYSSDAPEYRKDPNEVLQKDGGEALRAAIAQTLADVQEIIDDREQRAAAEAQEAEAQRAANNGAEMVKSFLQDVQSRRYEPMPTGITDIDKGLSGGFTRQQLVILGAAPGAGKTALAQWIFEGMATRGTPCVFVNLEMSRNQLLARSISRVAARRGFKITTSDIMQGYKWTPAQREAIEAAAREYAATIAPRMTMNPDGITANLDTIIKYIEAEAARAEKVQQVAPVVVIDYLQLITGDPREDTAAVIKRAMAAFKRYAMQHNTVVFVIIAHNRTSNSSGNVSMESARDTSAIEYSADIQLALTFTQCLERTGQTAKAPEKLSEDEKKNVTLRVTKARFGGRGTDADLYFNGATMTYTQKAYEPTPTNEPTPFDHGRR